MNILLQFVAGVFDCNLDISYSKNRLNVLLRVIDIQNLFLSFLKFHIVSNSN